MWDFWAWKSAELEFHLWPVFLDTANQWAISTHCIFLPVILACMVLQLLTAIWTKHFPPTIAKLLCWLGVVSLFFWCDYAVRHINKTSVFLIEAVLLYSSPLLAAQFTGTKNCNNMQQKPNTWPRMHLVLYPRKGYLSPSWERRWYLFGSWYLFGLEKIAPCRISQGRIT